MDASRLLKARVTLKAPAPVPWGPPCLPSPRGSAWTSGSCDCIRIPTAALLAKASMWESCKLCVPAPVGP